MLKKYHLLTYGCQMNIADSENMAGILEGVGMSRTTHLLECDLLLINTCSVRQAAEDKVYGLAPKIKLLKNNNPQAVVVLTGCLVGSVRGERRRWSEKALLKKIPWVDYLVETNDFACFINQLGQKGILKLPALVMQHSFRPKRDMDEHAYLPISNGCDNFCTYCVVPYARGPEISRSQTAILKKATQLTKEGYSHLTLLGQNVNSWGIKDLKQKLAIRANSNESLPFAALLRELHQLEKLNKISFLSSNPFDFTMDLVRTLAWPKIDRQLHLAVQSGDNTILKKMNRRHTKQDFLTLVENIKREVPDIQISTDIIVGFPGEDERAFQNTVALCKKVHFTLAYISMYSPRIGTNAYKFEKDNIPLKIKKQRHAMLSDIIKQYRL